LISSEYDPIKSSWGNVDFAHATLKNSSDNKLLVLPNLRYHQHLFLKEPARQKTLTAIELWLDRRMHSLND